MIREAQNSLREYLRRHHEVILLGAILLIALTLRLYQLEHDGFWIDELTQIRLSRLPFSDMIRDVLADVGTVPVEYIITHFVYYYIGRSEGILRLPAVLWGVLSVATIYFLGKRMFDKTTGFLAAATLTILPSHVYYSQEMRPYSLAAFMILLITLTFHRALERNTRGAWALYGATLAVGMYSHYYVAIAGILHGAYLMLMGLAKRLPWKRLLPYIAAAGVAGLLFLPWVLADTFGSPYTFRRPAASALFEAPFGSPGTTYRFALSHPLTWFGTLAWAGAIAGVCLFIRGKSPTRDNLGLPAIVSLAGMASVLALDYTAPYFFASRQFAPYAPTLVLSAAGAAVAVVRALAQRLARADARDRIAAVAAALLMVFAAASLGGPLAQSYRYEKEDWRGVARYLLQHVRHDDIILTRIPYYLELYAPELKKQTITLKGVATIQSQAKKHKRVWVLDRPYALRRNLPEVLDWAAKEKPLEVKGFSTLCLYLYSEQMTRQELEASLPRW